MSIEHREEAEATRLFHMGQMDAKAAKAKMPTSTAGSPEAEKDLPSRDWSGDIGAITPVISFLATAIQFRT